MKRSIFFILFCFLLINVFKLYAYKVIYLKVVPFKITLQEYAFLKDALKKLLCDRIYLPGRIVLVKDSEKILPNYLIKGEVDFLNNAKGIIKVNVINLKTHKKNYFEEYFEDPSEIIFKICDISQRIKDWLGNQKEIYYRINPYDILKEINRLNGTRQQHPGSENKVH